MLRLLSVLICLLTAACQSLQGDNLPATMHVELDAYATEAAQIQSEAVALRTQAAATIQAAGTQAADYFHYNNILIATVRAVIPAVSSERIAVQLQGAGGANVDTMSEMGDATRLAGVGIVSVITPDDNCFDSQSTLFRVNEVNTLYLAVLASSMQAGTRLEVAWEYNGQIVYQPVWIAQTSDLNICIDIPISAADAAFEVGQWAATLFVDEEQFVRIPFKIQ